MPELPEVETVRRILMPQLVQKTITAVCVRNSQIIAHPDAVKFKELLQGQTITTMSRRGKFLTIHFASEGKLRLHLRMTGQLLVLSAAEPIQKHTHLILYLSDGNQLRYIDVRRFGRFWYFKNEETDEISGQSRLGPEPTDNSLTAEYLKLKLGNKRKAIKEALLDQTIVAGIGNIYADEILFAAGIYPGTRCSALKDSNWFRLAEKIPEIILWGINANEMTTEEYLAGKGRDYRNISGLRAYGHTGKPCGVCGRIMEKVTIGGRTSCYCLNCQRLPME